MPSLPAIQLDRASAVPLHEQLGCALRAAIAKGEYRPGDALPSIRELADAAGVAVVTARHALMALAAEGLTTMRKHVGSVVAAGITPAYFKKRVVIFSQWHYFPYYYSQLIGEIRMRLVRDGGVLVSVASRNYGENVFPQLDEQLKERCDLIVEIGYDPVSRRAIQESGEPFLAIGDGWRTVASKSPNFVGSVDVRNRLGNLDFVRDCIRKGVKSVVQFAARKLPFSIAEPLAVAGIRSEAVLIGHHKLPGETAESSYAIMRTWLEGHRGALPDVIFFTDDHIARGGLCALACAGVKVPDDVAVVSHANKGYGPVWERPLTRLEMDPEKHGRAIAEAISGFLAGHAFPTDFVLGSAYVRGETF